MPLFRKNNPIATDPRRQYRLSSSLDGTLSVAVVLPDGTAHPAELVDVSAGGTCLRWSPERTVELNVGQPVMLRMQACTADTPVTIHATVRWLGADNEGNNRYGLEFRNLDELFVQLSPTLWRLFNARRARR